MGSEAEVRFAELWAELYPEVDLHTQHLFALPRRFSFDFCHFPSKVAIEIQGGIHTTGGHSTGKGIQRDMEKQQIASELGWLVIPLSVADSETVQALEKVSKTIQRRMK